MSSTRLQRSLRTTAIGLVLNGVLAVVKLVAGVAGHSMALVADAIESFADLASSLVVWAGVVWAHQPPDAEHPYGHGKAETLAAAAVAVLLLGAAIVIVIEAALNVNAPHIPPAPFTLFVLLGVILIKEGLFRFVNRVGDELDSSALLADAWHHRSDAMTSAAVALGISIALVGGPGYEVADDWAALFAAGVIAWNGCRLLLPVMRELMDAAPQGELLNQARDTARAVAGVRGVEKCLARKMGYQYFLEMHVEVDGELSVAAAHEVAHRVKDGIRARLPQVRDVTIHIEPYPPVVAARRP